MICIKLSFLVNGICFKETNYYIDRHNSFSISFLPAATKKSENQISFLKEEDE